VVEGKRQRAQAVKADHTQVVVNGYEDPCDVPLLVLACTEPKPAVEIGLATREPLSSVMLL
ncbi:MAG TPA: hypothetical protein VNW71_17540, partial [Thermoanaerobaculia bacterium]|nr:hypothetical protein [Thermoanaerobaculia bacterium]